MEALSKKFNLFGKHPDRTTLILRWVVAVVLVGLAVAAVLAGIAHAMSPAAIRAPKSTHYHFRMQLINDGQPVNFGDKAFQTPLNHDVCSAKLTKEPVHFHDRVDQFVHVHWDHVTGALLLKNYGWNLSGGLPGSLGYRFDKLPGVTNVPVHGKVLPQAPQDARYYIYTGDDSSYRERDWNKFLNEDLNVFFGHPKVTASSASSTGLWSWLVPAASATSFPEETQAPPGPAKSTQPTPAPGKSSNSPTPRPHNHSGTQGQTPSPSPASQAGGGQSQEELAKINRLVGNVVIFVQKDRPSDQAVKKRFTNLVPMLLSACGG